jgi:hypothetical protein
MDKCRICNKRIWPWQTYTIKEIFLKNGTIKQKKSAHWKCYFKEVKDDILKTVKEVKRSLSFI